MKKAIPNPTGDIFSFKRVHQYWKFSLLKNKIMSPLRKVDIMGLKSFKPPVMKVIENKGFSPVNSIFITIRRGFK